MPIGPIPPDELIQRVGVAAETEHARAAKFERIGRDSHADIVSALPADWSWQGKRVLDFGCGSGRVLRWFLPYVDAGAEFVGCDIHAATTEWMAKHYPQARIYANDEQPPLPEADASFDLVYCASVFSHLEDWAPWLLELRRVLRPGGRLVASIHGRGYWDRGVAAGRGEPWDENATGLLIEYPGAGFEDSWGPAVYVSEWWLREHWGRALRIASFEPSGFGLPDARAQGQAWVVAERDERDAPSIEGLRAPSADSRELPSALRGQRLAYAEAAIHLAQVGQLWRDVQLMPGLYRQLQDAYDRIAELERRDS